MLRLGDQPAIQTKFAQEAGVFEGPPCCWSAIVFASDKRQVMLQLATALKALQTKRFGTQSKGAMFSAIEQAMVLQHEARTCLSRFGVRPDDVPADPNTNDQEEFEMWKWTRMMELHQHSTRKQLREAAARRRKIKKDFGRQAEAKLNEEDFDSVEGDSSAGTEDATNATVQKKHEENVTPHSPKRNAATLTEESVLPLRTTPPDVSTILGHSPRSHSLSPGRIAPKQFVPFIPDPFIDDERQ